MSKTTIIAADLIHHPVLHNCSVTFELFCLQKDLIHGATSTYKIITLGLVSSGRILFLRKILPDLRNIMWKLNGFLPEAIGIIRKHKGGQSVDHEPVMYSDMTLCLCV